MHVVMSQADDSSSVVTRYLTAAGSLRTSRVFAVIFILVEIFSCNMAANDPPPPKRAKRNLYNADIDDDSSSADEVDDLSSHYEVRELSRSVARLYGMEEFNFEARLRHERLPNPRLLDVSDSLHAMFQDVLDRAGRHYNADDRIRMHIEHSGLDTPIIIHIQPKHDVTAATVMDR